MSEVPLKRFRFKNYVVWFRGQGAHLQRLREPTR